MFAGHETTANTLVYIIYLLAIFPDWQTWAIHEIDEIFSGMPLEDGITYQTIPSPIPQDIIPQSAISGDSLNIYDLLAIIVQFNEVDPGTALCVPTGGLLQRSWSRSSGETAALQAAVFGPSGASLCDGYGDWSSSFLEVLHEWDQDEHITGGISVWSSTVNGQTFSVQFSFAKHLSSLSGRDLGNSTPKYDGSVYNPLPLFHIGQGDTSYNGTVEDMAKAVRLGDLGFVNPDTMVEKLNERDLIPRAISCGGLTYRRSDAVATCNCNGNTYTITCTTYPSRYQGWTKSLMDKALNSLVKTISANTPAAGAYITSNPKGAVLTNGWTPARNFLDAPSLAADCCKSGIQLLRSQLDQYEIPAMCDCSKPGNDQDWLLSTGGTIASDNPLY
ncbi:hypothetical protein PENSUB_8643 [Penicillium subrubescens]|uniref:Uncharacterized protein n=1 Tax=Penicillium subrubescens TaxID=1316194 RepID=A0A1Q5TGA4_9EURO|nr:hypothetical protein PENSUB_8643 [Penicillium subrubescens]